MSTQPGGDEKSAANEPIHGPRRDYERAIDAPVVHNRDHLVTGHLGWSGQHVRPQPAGMIPLVCMQLHVDERHEITIAQPCRCAMARSVATSIPRQQAFLVHISRSSRLRTRS